MKLEEIKTWLEENKDTEEVKAFVGGLNPVNVDKVKSLVNSDKALKAWLDSEKDTHYTKAHKTWEENNLQKLINEAVTKANPQETPEQKKIRELTERIEKSEKDRAREALKNKALKTATDKKLPSDLIDYFLGDDEEATNKNLEKLESIFTTHVNTVAEERLKGGYVPPKSDKKLSSEEQVLAEMEKYFKA